MSFLAIIAIIFISSFVLVVVGSCSYRMEILVFFRSPKSNSNIPLFDSASQSLGLLASPWVASTLKGRLLDSRLRLKLSFLQLQLNTTTTLTTTIYSNITKYPPAQSMTKLRLQISSCYASSVTLQREARCSLSTALMRSRSSGESPAPEGRHIPRAKRPSEIWPP